MGYPEQVQVTTQMKETEDGEFFDVVQTIELTEGGELVYHAEGRNGEVRVNAEEYVGKLRALTGL